MITLQRVDPASDADLRAWLDAKARAAPHEAVFTLEQMRSAETPDRLLLLAESDGRVVGCGIAGKSSLVGRAFVMPRVVPEERRRGAGTALLRELAAHAAALDLDVLSVNVEEDAGLAFASRFGFEEIDREVEQTRAIAGDERPPVPADGLQIVSIAERPELLEAAYAAVGVDGYADMPIPVPISVPLEEWLREEATLPEGSFVALADERIVGYAGLITFGDASGKAEHGLTAVARDWRGRGVASTLKRTQIAWAAANGYRELVTWTQRGNEDMQRLNHHLGYVTTSISRRLAAQRADVERALGVV